MKTKRILQFTALFLILVVFPGVSWYYLKSGLNFRKEVLADLQDLGPLPQPTLPDALTGIPVPADSLKGRMTVSGFANLANPVRATTFGEIMSGLHDQFNEREELQFLSFLVVEDTLTFPDWQKKYALDKDPIQCHFMPANADAIDRAADVYQLTCSWKTGLPMVLSDLKGNMRRQYDVSDPAQLHRLIEQIALLLPLKTNDKVILKREKEK